MAMADALRMAPTAMIIFMLCRSIILPTNGIASADTIMNAKSAEDRVERLRSRSSVIGTSTSPNTYRDPLPKKSTANPTASMMWG